MISQLALTINHELWVCAYGTFKIFLGIFDGDVVFIVIDGRMVGAYRKWMDRM